MPSVRIGDQDKGLQDVRLQKGVNKMTKYELTTNSQQWLGHTIYKIRALRDIEECGVKAGDLGGWVEGLKNLSQNGNAWVFGDAWVSGDARVSGDAWVCAPYDYTVVQNIGSREASTTFARARQGGILVTCGCWHGTIEAFGARVRDVHGDNVHGKAYQSAIRMALEVVNQEPCSIEKAP